MVVETDKETLCISQIIGQKTNSVIIEEDFVVPDIKPDILNVINTSGTVCIYKKEIMEGKIRIDGSINTYIIYLADNENTHIRSINTNLDFSQIIDFEGLKPGVMVDVDMLIKEIECRVINTRKISVRAIVDVNLKAYSNEKLEFINQINDIKDIQLLKESMQVNSLLGIGDTKVYAKDTVMLENIDELAEIMKVSLEIKNKEIKISYNKVLIKADCCLKIMYLTTDNRICSKTTLIPVMGFIDIKDVTDDSICDVKYEIKNILIKPQSIEEHSIYVEIEIGVNCEAYQTKDLNIIQDLYSPSVNLTYKQNIIKTIAQKNCIRDICPIREKQTIEGLQNNRIYDVDVRPYILKQNVMSDRVIFEGEIELYFIFGSDNVSQINSSKVIIPFNYNMNCPEINENSKINTSIEVSLQDFVVMPDESIDVKIDLQFIVDSLKSEEINLIKQIDIEENRDFEKYSVVIYFVKPNDTLWKIAKRFRSTVDSIANINGIEDENEISVGQQLFIPISN